MRIPLAVGLKIGDIQGSSITDYDSGITNGIVKKKNGRLIVTQRPSINMFEDASDHIADAQGRAIYYWGVTSALYVVNKNKVYKSTQASAAIGTITAGTKKCKFVELGSLLVLLDSENSEAWTINSSGTVTQITDVDFPTEQTPAVNLAHGAVVLDQAVYVLDVDGNVYGSDTGDATSWNALNYLNAERDPDGGSFIGKHHDDVVVMGPRSIEFFYDASNSSGSPLSRRQDVSYNIGCNDGESCWEVGDRIFFVGVNESGSLGVYKIERLSIVKASEEDLDAFLTNAIVHEGYGCTGSGFSAGGHYYYTLTLYTTSTTIQPERTLVYDDTAGIWYPSWTTTIGGQTHFPIMDWSVRSTLSSRVGEGILSNGDLISPNDNLIPQDTKGAQIYVAADYVADQYVTSSPSNGTAIPLVIRTGQNDLGTFNVKLCPRLAVIGDSAKASQTITVKWSDENNDGFATASGRTLDFSVRRFLRRCGRFTRRNYQLEHSSTERLDLEAIELDLIKSGK